MEKFYDFVALAEAATAKQIYTCGTLRSNRKKKQKMH